MSTRAEFLVFSDFHAHNFKYGARRVHHIDPSVGGLFNSRLMDCVTVLRDLETYAKEHDISTLVFGGDLFHTRNSLKTDVLTVIYRELARISETCQLVMVPGNHDYGDRAGYVHSLSVFESVPNVTVLDSVSSVELFDSVNLISVPYTDDPEDAKLWLKKAGDIADALPASSTKVLLAHLGMQGARVGSDYVLLSSSDVSTNDVPYDKFTTCFFGHYHEHQMLFPNGWFIGATHHHNWGDAGTQRGFLHCSVTDQELSFTRVETSAPRFLNVKDGDNAEPRPQDFVRYHYSPGASVTQLKELQESWGVKHFEPIEHDVSSETMELPEDQLTPSVLVTKLVEQLVPPTEQALYNQLGQELLQEAEREML